MANAVFWEVAPLCEPTFRRLIPEDDSLLSHRRENLKSYVNMAITNNSLSLFLLSRKHRISFTKIILLMILGDKQSFLRIR
jgi:hypothetical protein